MGVEGGGEGEQGGRGGEGAMGGVERGQRKSGVGWRRKWEGGGL